MKVYFVRHGESQGNVLRIHQDGKVKLSDHGQEQAKNVAERFAHINIDVILASDYERAFKTAQTIAKKKDLPVTTTPLLREVKRPTEIEGKKYDDATTRVSTKSETLLIASC